MEQEQEIINFKSNLNYEELTKRLIEDLPFDVQMALKESEN